jgi:phosphoribosylformimino-5-aminoimidazole carboxamide ribonucleotide (ProFAR) isomerase|tara:strand:- start:2072 stop:2380 length:309 start_codon:yes stop_codon:yes gene_type:complete
MALLEDVVIFCKKELNIPDEILVSLETEDLSEDNVKGWTTDSAEDDEYDIEIDTHLGFKESIITVCHEMVHVQQLHENRELDENEAYEKEEMLYKKYINSSQ